MFGKRPTVSELLAMKEEKRKRSEEETAILHAGYRTPFWALLEKEWAHRYKLEVALVCQTAPGTPENNAKIQQAQARIAVIEGMFNLAKIYRNEEVETSE